MSNQIIQPIKIFNHDFLYTAYADDTTVFIKKKNVVIKLSNNSDKFSALSGLNRTNQNKKSQE